MLCPAWIGFFLAYYPIPDARDRNSSFASWLVPDEAFQIERPQTYLVSVSASQAEACPPEAVIERVIQNGIPLDRFRSGRAKGSYVLGLGRKSARKRFDRAMDAASVASVPFFFWPAQRFGYPAHRNISIGKSVPNERRAPLSRPSGTTPKTTSDSGRKCVLIPSLAPETSSLVAMEAMACGTPVVAFPSGAASRTD